jgi:hypothetical protein
MAGNPVVGGTSLIEPGHGSCSVTWDASARARVIDALAQAGLKLARNFARECEEAGTVSAAEVVAICDEFRANRQCFKHAGAIAHRIREGVWPAEGVLPVAERHALTARQQTDTAEIARRKMRQAMIDDLDELVRKSRKLSLPPLVITELVRQKFPHDFCDAQGWPDAQTAQQQLSAWDAALKSTIDSKGSRP